MQRALWNPNTGQPRGTLADTLLALKATYAPPELTASQILPKLAIMPYPTRCGVTETELTAAAHYEDLESAGTTLSDDLKLKYFQERLKSHPETRQIFDAYCLQVSERNQVYATLLAYVKDQLPILTPAQEKVARDLKDAHLVAAIQAKQEDSKDDSADPNFRRKGQTSKKGDKYCSAHGYTGHCSADCTTMKEDPEHFKAMLKGREPLPSGHPWRTSDGVVFDLKAYKAKKRAAQTSH